MSFTTKNIDRKHAEAARRRAIELGGRGASADASLSEVREVCECVALWNAFCGAEVGRLARRDETLARIRHCRDARLLGRAARLFLTWGSRHLADVAHTRRGVVLQNRYAKACDCRLVLRRDLWCEECAG